MTCIVRAGASGFSYREWRGRFYPAQLTAAKMLPFYAERLATVEINYTFRAMPKRPMLAVWAAKTPPHFRFALKAPQRITHFSRLKNTKEMLDYFLETVRTLEDRLGPILFQLPPDLPRDDQLLAQFLDQLDGRVRAAFEFRHRSWFCDEVFALLRGAAAALCVAQSETLASPVLRTAEFLYLRLRNEFYDHTALADWADRIRQLGAGANEAYIFFKHEAAAPELALELQKLLRD